ncbi:GNAT family N-acetyltransferase [Streptomyces sp. A0642]|uniref:GNAT family N-acetyltransferase n=1 Tax=Streptomyces sp. A0642 TaxID=2563100 RepID=UPI0010A275F1|nr:GNAT family N-acetyltransferase [Streptomyces sp. A0642]THA66200.1 GNAT family N-acetyltransferase [Streptomyces sp. A0642]
MTWTFTDDVDVFLDAAGPWLTTRPAESTVVWTVTAALRRHGPHAYGDHDPVLGWWRGADGEVAGTLVHTPPHPASLNGLPPEAVAPLMAARRLTLVNADRATAVAVAAHWPRHRVVEELRLYRLGELAPPSPAPGGRARPATPADRDLLLRWYAAFAVDIGGPAGQVGRHARAVDERTTEGRLTLWEHDGVPVSMAGISPRTAGTARVAPVYTPPGHRGRGYAAAVTAEVSRAARDAGADEVLLFTDLANPTSNGVYTRIGYRPLSDRLVVGAEDTSG